MGSKEGVTDQEIQELASYRDSRVFDPADKVALELSDAATQTPAEVSDELFSRLREYYSEAQLVELAAIVVLGNFRSRFNRMFDVEPNGFYCPLPARR